MRDHIHLLLDSDLLMRT